MTRGPTRRSRSEGFALTRYVVPGCLEDGAWMLWENSSAAVVVAHESDPVPT
jgi:hypothetical protein